MVTQPKSKPKPKKPKPKPEEKAVMLRKVVTLTPQLHARAMAFIAEQRAMGSLLRLPELLRQSLHHYLETRGAP